jgi:SH3-like domain-containing protein
MPWATRILLTLAIVMVVGYARAATSADQENIDVPRVTPSTKAGASRIEAQPGRVPGDNSHTHGSHTDQGHTEKAHIDQAHSGKALGDRAHVGQAQAPRPQAGDQKGRAVPAVAVPPAPKPPREPPSGKELTEPPPKLPRFAALKTDDTNMRKGPGQRYPIDWVYQRRDLPVEVEREYDVWRYVRDADGVEGWVHQVTLSDRRTFLITDKDATLRADTKDTATSVAVLKVGVIGRLRQCDAGSKWCEVQVGGYRGYLRREQFWGLLPDETVGPS